MVHRIRPLFSPLHTMLPLLMLLEVVSANLEAACSAGEAESFRISVNSRRNETFHRIVSVDVSREAGAATTAGDGMALDVVHGRSLCGNNERVHLTAVAVGVEPRPRRADYELFPGLGYYKLHTAGNSWENARASCISEQAHLIVINSEAEANVVKELFSRKPQFEGVSSGDYIYAGFHDKFTEGNFITVTGQALGTTGYTRWDAREPDGGTSQNLGAVSRQGLLHDIPIAWKLGYLCEQEL